MTERTGRCLCGQVKFRLTADPIAARICWCKDCQHIAGNGTANMLVSADALHVEGTLTDYVSRADSGHEMHRQFCPSCGTHVMASTPTRPTVRVLRIGNLDDPSSVKPTMNIWTSSAPEWACMSEAMEQCDKQPAPPPPKA
jgi:hypothetical protein